jgi:hypothetical protein
MNKIKKALIAAVIVGSVGISYALYTLNGLPETFDWDEDEE